MYCIDYSESLMQWELLKNKHQLEVSKLQSEIDVRDKQIKLNDVDLEGIYHLLSQR